MTFEDLAAGDYLIFVQVDWLDHPEVAEQFVISAYGV
jgi:hypothetical protein